MPEDDDERMVSQMPAFATSITRPTLLIDPARVKANLDWMITRAHEAGVLFRPHFKTHQSAVIGTWFADRGVQAIAVSSVEMAVYFAAAGWKDITLAVPLNPRQLDEIRSLSERADLGLLIDSSDALEQLPNQWPRPVRMWIKVDVGYGRAGVLWNDHRRLIQLAQGITAREGLSFGGLLTHSGHTYHASTPAEIQEIHRESIERMRTAQFAVRGEGDSQAVISIGDTPSCSLATDFAGVDEIRPGNFVFYDLMQEALGACSADRIALAVLCPVLGKYPRRKQLVIYGGAVHFSKERLTPLEGPFAGRKVYGHLMECDGSAFGTVDFESALVGLTQEHGILEVPRARVDQIHIGDLLAFAPVHACLTGNLHGQYLTLDGKWVSRLTSSEVVQPRGQEGA